MEPVWKSGTQESRRTCAFPRCPDLMRSKFFSPAHDRSPENIEEARFFRNSIVEETNPYGPLNDWLDSYSPRT
jgi:hypothetical protein